MKTIELKELWLKNKSRNTILSKEEIADLSAKRNRNIYYTLQKWTVFNILFKMLLGLGIIIAFFLFEFSFESKIINITLVFILFGLQLYDLRIHQKIKQLRSYSEDLNSNLGRLKTFFSFEFGSYNLFAGLAYPILIFIGMEYYLLMVYGQMRALDYEDIIVLTLILMIGYSTGIIGSYRLTKDIKSEIETSLVEFEEDKDEKIASEFLINKLRRKKILNIVYLSIVLIGIIAFAISLLFYFKSS